MPIYEYECDVCGKRFEEIKLHPIEEPDAPMPCPTCGALSEKVVSKPRVRMGRIYDNAELGPRAFFGEPYAKHEEWKELAEESEMVMKKRQELIDRRELSDFIYEEGKYDHGEDEPAKTIEEV